MQVVKNVNFVFELNTVWPSNVVLGEIVWRPPGDPPHTATVKAFGGSPDDFRPETFRTIAVKPPGSRGFLDNFLIAGPRGT